MKYQVRIKNVPNSKNFIDIVELTDYWEILKNSLEKDGFKPYYDVIRLTPVIDISDLESLIFLSLKYKDIIFKKI